MDSGAEDFGGQGAIPKPDIERNLGHLGSSEIRIAIKSELANPNLGVQCIIAQADEFGDALDVRGSPVEMPSFDVEKEIVVLADDAEPIHIAKQRSRQVQIMDATVGR